MLEHPVDHKLHIAPTSMNTWWSFFQCKITEMGDGYSHYPGRCPCTGYSGVRKLELVGCHFRLWRPESTKVVNT